MAGLAATRLFASAGAGGIALTAWALRRSGHGGPDRGLSDDRVHGAALRRLHGHAGASAGSACTWGSFPGPAPFAITVIPAIFGAVVIAVFLLGRAAAGGLRALRGPARRTAEHRLGRLARTLAAAPATAATGVRTALSLVRSRDPYLLGAVAWWAFDISVLWACFHAFGCCARDRGRGDGLLRRDVRQHAAAAGRDRRRRRRHDRGVHGVRGTRSRSRRWPCSRTAGSRSGCRRSRGRSPTCSCAGRLRAGRPRSRSPGPLAILNEVTERSRKPRDHRQRPGGLHRRAVRRAGQPRAARLRGVRLGRPAPADDRRRELPRLPERDHGPGADAAVPRSGRALRRPPGDRRRHRGRALTGRRPAQGDRRRHRSTSPGA